MSETCFLYLKKALPRRIGVGEGKQNSARKSKIKKENMLEAMK